ncbi:MAG: hypothetical protein RSA50_07245 [Mucinivorans sp.]
MNKIVLTVASLVAMCGQVMAQGGEQLLQFWHGHRTLRGHGRSLHIARGRCRLDEY